MYGEFRLKVVSKNLGRIDYYQPEWECNEGEISVAASAVGHFLPESEITIEYKSNEDSDFKTW